MDVWSPTCFRMAADRFKYLSSAVTPGFRIASPEEAGESPFPLDNYLPWRSRLVIGNACYQRLKTSRDQRKRWIERLFQQAPREPRPPLAIATQHPARPCIGDRVLAAHFRDDPASRYSSEELSAMTSFANLMLAFAAVLWVVVARDTFSRALRRRKS